MIDWNDGYGYERLVKHYQLPPDSYVKGVVSRLQGNGDFGLGYHARARDEMIWDFKQQELVLGQLAESVYIYKQALKQSRQMLELDHKVASLTTG